MLKKLLILPLIGGLMSITAIASADTVDGFTSDSNIGFVSFSNTSDPYSSTIAGNGNYICISSSDIPFYLDMSAFENPDPNYIYINSAVKCFSDNPLLSYSDYNMYIYSDYEEYIEKEISGKIYYSSSPITYSSSSDNDSSTVFPSIPSSFTSGITALVSNFGSTLVGWLPTIILVALGITAIFALFRVVRGYARSSFRG